MRSTVYVGRFDWILFYIYIFYIFLYLFIDDFTDKCLSRLFYILLMTLQTSV